MRSLVRSGAVVSALIALLLVLAAASIPHASFAQTADDVAARRAALQAQLDAINAQITQTQGTLTTLGGQHQSLQRDINILDANIKKAQLQVKATQVQLQALAQNITLQGNTIQLLSGKIDNERESLAEVLRQTQQIDDYSLVEVALSSEDLSGFFSDLDSFAALNQQIDSSTKELASTKQSTESQRTALESQQVQVQKLKELQVLAQNKVVDEQNQKKVLLAQTKSQESAYQTTLAAQQKTATQIRAELFALAGGSGQISLPAAIAFAKQAGASTGVRPALILGILKQETNLGQNVGQCLLTNAPNKGDGKGKNTGTPFAGVMKPTRDVDPFMQITAALGIDPFSQVVSCPQAGGYGGAMGPAQFIASTWVLYENRIASAAGHPSTIANPWSNLDAFTATALLMADNGATAQTRDAERLAALRYFAGWGGASNPAYSFYGDGVMGFADQFQQDIDTLSGS